MNHIIHNISIILIFFGIIFLTYNLTLSYNKCPRQQPIIQQNNNTQFEDVFTHRPSKVFNVMFRQPDVWMGYADFNTQTYSKLL